MLAQTHTWVCISVQPRWSIIVQALAYSMTFSKPIFLLFITFHRAIHAQNCLLTLQFGPDLELRLFGDG